MSARTKVRQIYPSKLVPEAFAAMGREPSMGCPVGWVRSILQDVERAVQTQSERDSLVVYGLEKVRINYTDELTPEEQTRDALAELEQRFEAARKLLPREGEALSAAQVEALRKALLQAPAS